MQGDAPTLLHSCNGQGTVPLANTGGVKRKLVASPQRLSARVYAMPHRGDKRTRGQRLAEAIDNELAARGVTRNAFADEHGLEGSHIKRWLDGTSPTLDTIERWADALGRPPLDLLHWAGYDVARTWTVLTPRERIEAALAEVGVSDEIKDVVLSLVDKGKVVRTRRRVR